MSSVEEISDELFAFFRSKEITSAQAVSHSIAFATTVMCLSNIDAEIVDRMLDGLKIQYRQQRAEYLTRLNDKKEEKNHE